MTASEISFVKMAQASHLRMATPPKTRTERYARVYAALKLAGHSPATAVEIIIDAKRPSAREIAMAFVRHAHRAARR